MPEQDLTQLIRSLSPGALAIFKRQLASLPEVDKQRAFSRLTNVPELSDIIGKATPISAIAQTQPKPTMQTQELQLWQKGLQAIGKPFQEISEHITEPFGAYISSAFTPAIAGTEGMGWAERERAEYKGWQEPTMTMPWGGQFRPTKGILETLPWLALPSAGAVAGRLGVMAKAGGTLGRGAALAGKVVKPIAAVEAVPGKIIGKVVEKVAGKVVRGGILRRGEIVPIVKEAEHYDVLAKELGFVSTQEKMIAAGKAAVVSFNFPESGTMTVRGVKAKLNPKDLDNIYDFGVKNKQTKIVFQEPLIVGKGVIRSTPVEIPKPSIGIPPVKPLGRNPSEIWKDLSKPQRMTLANSVGLQKRVDWRSWATIEPETQKLLASKMTEIGAQPEKYKIVSELFPEGFNPAQQTAIQWAIAFAKKLKPLRKETEALYKAGRAEQAIAYEAKLEELTAQGMAPKEALAQAKKALYMGGELPKAPLPAGTASVVDREAEKMGQELYGIIRDAPYKSAFDRVNINEALARLLDPKVQGLPRDFEFKLLEKTFGSDLVKELLKKRSLGTRIWEQVMDISGAPIALLASCDVSGLLRQGGILMARHPIEGIKTVTPMLESLFSDKNATLVERIIRSRQGMEELLDDTLETVLFQAPLPTKVAVKLLEKEEMFATSILNKLYPIKASNRAYVTVLNDMRSRSALKTLNYWKATGKVYTKEDISDLNQMVNWASGRGTIPKALQGFATPMRVGLFAPRLILSKVEFPLTVLPAVTKSKLVRDEAWKTIIAGLGAGAGILTMAKLSGAGDIELDPRSADFGKLRVRDEKGNLAETRLDIWTGYAQYIRFLAQLATAQRKTEGGRIQPLNRREVGIRFLESKLSPAIGLLNDLAKGQTYMGEELPPKSVKGVAGQIYQRMMPLAIQDLIDGVNQDGVVGGIVSLASFMGIGAVTYTDEAKKERDKVAQKQYGMTWDEVGLKYGRAEQLKLEQETPSILKAEQEQEKRFATGTPTITGQFQKEGQAIEDTYRKEIGYAVNKFRQSNDGNQFRNDVEQASKTRRTSYGSRAERKEYQDLIASYNQPLTLEQKAKMNPGDVLRREYYQQMFSVDMYDPNTNEYNFDEAERREQTFLVENGQQALDYIESYSAALWKDKPTELKALEQAKDLLRPYWNITDQIWSMYPAGLQDLSNQIVDIAKTNEPLAKQMLRRYPMILRARELIARLKQQMRNYNPEIKRAYQLFYSY